MFQTSKEKPYAQISKKVLSAITGKVKEIQAAATKEKPVTKIEKVSAYSLDEDTVFVKNESDGNVCERDLRELEFADALIISKMLKGASPVLQSYRFLGIGQKASLKGECFYEYINKRYQERNFFTVEQASSIVLQLLLGLKALEDKGLFHFDLKLENILVMSEEPLTIMIIDVGYNRLTSKGEYKQRQWKQYNYDPPCSKVYIPEGINRDSLYKYPKKYDLHCLGMVISGIVSCTKQVAENKGQQQKYNYLKGLSKRTKYDAGRNLWRPGKRWSSLSIDDILQEEHWGSTQEERETRIKAVTAQAEDVLKKKTRGFYHTVQPFDKDKKEDGQNGRQEENPLLNYLQLAPPEIRDIVLLFDTLINNEESFVELIDSLREDSEDPFDADDIYLILEAIQERSKELFKEISKAQASPASPVDVSTAQGLDMKQRPAGGGLKNIPSNYATELDIIKDNLSCRDDVDGFINEVKVFTRRFSLLHKEISENGYSENLPGDNKVLISDLQAFIKASRDSKESGVDESKLQNGKILKEKCLKLLEIIEKKAREELPHIQKRTAVELKIPEKKERIYPPKICGKISFFEGARRTIHRRPPKTSMPAKVADMMIWSFSGIIAWPTFLGAGAYAAVATINHLGNYDSTKQLMQAVNEWVTDNAQPIIEIGPAAIGGGLLIVFIAFLIVTHEHRRSSEEEAKKVNEAAAAYAKAHIAAVTEERTTGVQQRFKAQKKYKIHLAKEGSTIRANIEDAKRLGTEPEISQTVIVRGFKSKDDRPEGLPRSYRRISV